jgi:hypothetical protein
MYRLLGRLAREDAMKQTIILLTMVILGIAISAMILTFGETTERITTATQNKMATQLQFSDE